MAVWGRFLVNNSHRPSGADGLFRSCTTYFLQGLNVVVELPSEGGADTDGHVGSIAAVVLQAVEGDVAHTTVEGLLAVVVMTLQVKLYIAGSQEVHQLVGLLERQVARDELRHVGAEDVDV